MNATKSHIILNDLILNIHLGWPEVERLVEQTVKLDINIQFHQPPSACASDNLHETYCYDTLVNAIKTHILPNNFRLLEHLAQEIYRVIRQTVSLTDKVSLRIKKQPNIPGLSGGVAFYYGDEENIW